MAQDQANGNCPHVGFPSEPQASPATTADWSRKPITDDGLAAGEALPALRPALVKQASPSLQLQVRDLLHRRLKIIALLFSLYLVIDQILEPQAWRLFYSELSVFLTRRPAQFVTEIVIPLGCVALTGVIWGRRSLSLRQLRSIELAIVGLAAGSGVLVLHSSALRFYGAPSAQIYADQAARYLSSEASNWALWLVGYGLFIPNTWRRCVLVTSFLAILPLLTVGVLCLGPEVPPGWSEPVLREALPQMALVLAVGAVLAIYGTHKITTLREVAHATRQLGQYKLSRRLGAGGMGEVYLAEHRLLKRPCAVKLIRPEKAADAAMLHRFEREVQAMTRLTHWNVVEVFDYGHTEDGTFYYVMEYLPGLTLEDLVRKHGPLPPGRAVHLLRQVCAALGEAHSKSLIHRDLKPGNVIVGERGGVHDVAKLLDFGLVQETDLGDAPDRLTHHGVLVGTPAYLSPEQANGVAQLLPSSDIYSLGAMAYFLVTGQPPFVRPSVVQTITAHLSDPVAPPAKLRPEVPADLEQVIVTCLAKRPDRRFQDANSLEQALKRCTCAGQWTQADAAAWWQTQGQPPPSPGLRVQSARNE